MAAKTAKELRTATGSSGSPPERDFVHGLVEAKRQTDPDIHEKVAKAQGDITLAEQATYIVKKLRAERQEKQMTQAEVAEKMGTSQSAVAKLESGDHPPMLESLERYAAAVGARVRFRLELACEL